MLKRCSPAFFIFPALCFLLLSATAQPDKNYHPLHSDRLIADKNFYLLTVIDQTPAINSLLAADPTLRGICTQRLTILNSHVTDSCRWAVSLVTDFRFTEADTPAVTVALQSLYRNNKAAFDKMIDQQLRPSGYYQRLAGNTNEDLLLHAWGQAAAGLDYIIDQYGLGKKMRYPRIDSASYDVNSPYYRTALKDIFAYLSEQEASMTTFFHPSLALALQLMDLNDRDEPARFEPLETGENRLAVAAIKNTDWSKYAYATIVIPGEGPAITTIALDPMGRMRCDLAAARYRKGLAPFIILSGGYCHPFHTPYNEAYEMKKYLLSRGIPESALIIEPQARHTTTNLRNADRLMIRYGIPLTKPSDIVSTKSQIDYIALPQQHFDERNLRELGYLPYRDKHQTSVHDVSFYPVMESLQIDPLDPLDP